MKKVLALSVLALVLVGPSSADDKKDVETRVKTAVDGVLSVLQDKGLDKKVRREKVLAQIEPLMDFKLMGKLALGKEHWPKLNAAQRDEFTKLFIEQLKASYFEKIDLYTDEKVQFGEAAAKGDKWTLKTHVITKDKPVEMIYKVYKDAGAWKVYDLEIEGVSIVRSYGSQYDEVLKAGTVEDLLKKMEAKAQLPKVKG